MKILALGKKTERFLFTGSYIILLMWLPSIQTLGARPNALELRAFDANLQSHRTVTIAAIGDSITWVCEHTDGKQNYATIVADALKQAYPQAEIRLILAGALDNTPTGLEHLQKDVLNYRPDLVFIMFGMNDCTRGPSNLDNYDRNLTEMIRRTRAAGAAPVLLTQNEVIYTSEAGKARLALPDYERRSVELARREHCQIVDNFTDWQKLKRQQPSSWTKYFDEAAIHPNLEGHRLIAQYILQKLWPEAGKYLHPDSHVAVTLTTRPCP